MSLKTRFILSFGIGGIILLLVITFLVFSRMESAMVNQLQKQFEIDTKNRIASLDYTFSELSRDFKTAAHLPIFRSMHFHELTLNQAAKKMTFVRWNYIFWTG